MYQQPQPPNYYPPQPQQGQGVYQQQVQQQQQQQQQQQSMMMPGQAMQHQHQQQQQPQMLQQPPQMMHHQHQNQHQQPQMQHQQPQMQQQPVMSRQPQPQMQQQQQQQPPQQQQQQQQRAPVRSPQYSRPPYVDPNTNIIYDTDNAEYEGFLTKQSMWLKDWRRRFFLLKGSKLFYCSNEYSTPHGMIDLALCTTVKSADLKSRKRNSFEISTPEITYLLYADTEQEKDDWIGRVGKAIVRCSSTYYSQSASGSGVRTTIGGGQRAPNPYGGGYGQNHPHSAIDSDDDDIYYEDPNNPNPYFND